MKKHYLAFTKLAVIASVLFTAHTSSAYLGQKETAEILPLGHYSLGLIPQFRLSDGGGFNGGAFVEIPYDHSLQGRVEIGSGDTDFWTAATAKWIPFPDVDNQPAMGLRGGLGFAREESLNFLHVIFGPIASKKYTIDEGLLTPYVGIPIVYTSAKDSNKVGSQLVFGSEFQGEGIRNYKIGGEIALKLSNSFSSLSLYISFPFDELKGYKK